MLTCVRTTGTDTGWIIYEEGVMAAREEKVIQRWIRLEETPMSPFYPHSHTNAYLWHTAAPFVHAQGHSVWRTDSEGHHQAHTFIQNWIAWRGGGTFLNSPDNRTKPNTDPDTSERVQKESHMSGLLSNAPSSGFMALNVVTTFLIYHEIMKSITKSLFTRSHE